LELVLVHDTLTVHIQWLVVCTLLGQVGCTLLGQVDCMLLGQVDCMLRGRVDGVAQWWSRG